MALDHEKRRGAWALDAMRQRTLGGPHMQRREAHPHGRTWSDRVTSHVCQCSGTGAEIKTRAQGLCCSPQSYLAALIRRLRSLADAIRLISPSGWPRKHHPALAAGPISTLLSHACGVL